MLKKQMAPMTRFLKRRDFLSRAAVLGGMAVLGASAGPVQAARKASGGSKKSASKRSKAISVRNATEKDFSDLINQRFRLRLADRTVVRVRLVETNSPEVRRAPRFRREHFSLIFDVPRHVELVQGRYRLSHRQIGSMNLFMVPVDLPAAHHRLEAVFT